ncbi:MAG TPA: DedA family protein [Bdellovibrionales bacterium]|nr:DedA family protein [Bdellovibrionales bacterium]
MIEQFIQLFMWAVDVILHLDAHLNALVAMTGPWIYVVLFIIVFCETGIVVTPFLPGDSLLFALGALATTEGTILSLPLLFITLFVAAVLGDATNYYIGARIGPKVFTSDSSRFLNREHLVRTQKFYEKHGGKTIVLARFMPIIRTFAPFVAGIGKMSYPRFAFYNVTGGFVWVAIFLLAGYQFGNLPAVKRNFHFVIIGIIVVSVLPVVIEWWKARRARPVTL